ncbi:MAG: adenine methyltransferase [Chloroflexi bacterium]|nr:adenine methyltransferase [Chloroflexota bacterium]
MNHVVFSSLSPNWDTPKAVFDELNTEFHFNDDPCPAGGIFGLDRQWGRVSFVNPPYSQIKEWMEKGLAEYREGKTVVFLIPARTDIRWFHDYVLPFASEIRFVRGRLKFGGAKINAPFPSMVVIFQSKEILKGEVT